MRVLPKDILDNFLLQNPLGQVASYLSCDTVIEFRTDTPFLQVQPVRKEFYADKFLRNVAVKDMADLSSDNWEAYYRTVVAPNVNPERSPGNYAVSVRKKSRNMFAGETTGE